MESLPLVSIILPTFNSAYRIEPCLKSIRTQTYPRVELIVVDRYSVDETRELARKYGAKTLLHPGFISAAKNLGLKHSKGRFILFEESDAELFPTMVERCVKACLRENADAVIVPPIRIGRNFWARCIAYEKRVLQEVGDPYYLTDLPIFYRREIFERFGGYDEKLLLAEDWDFYEKVKNQIKVVRITPARKHYELTSLKSMTLEAYRYGKTFGELARKHGFNAFKRHSPVVSPHYRRYAVAKALLENPVYSVGGFLLRFVRYLTGSLAMVAVFLGLESDPENF